MAINTITPFGALLLLLLTGCGQERERVIFSSSRNGNSDIFQMNPDGGDLRQLTASPYEEWAPSPVPPNSVSFLRQTDDSIYRITLDLASGIEAVIDHPENCTLDDKNTLQSPNSGAVIYPCDGEIFLQTAPDARPQSISGTLPGTSNYPSWSPDGINILFTNNGTGSNDIYQYSLRDEQIVPLTNNAFNNERGSYSPTTAHLLYSSDEAGISGQDLVILNTTTGGHTSFGVKQGMELIGQWSEDARYVYFGSNGEGDWEIYSYHLATKEIRRLTNSIGFDGDPRVLSNK